MDRCRGAFWVSKNGVILSVTRSLPSVYGVEGLRWTGAVVLFGSAKTVSRSL